MDLRGFSNDRFKYPLSIFFFFYFITSSGVLGGPLCAQAKQMKKEHEKVVNEFDIEKKLRPV